MRRRDHKLWPLSLTGTVIIIPLLAMLIVIGNYSFWWFVRELGEAGLAWAK
jgi:hypothetical protein